MCNVIDAPPWRQVDGTAAPVGASNWQQFSRNDGQISLPWWLLPSTLKEGVSGPDCVLYFADTRWPGVSYLSGEGKHDGW